MPITELQPAVLTIQPRGARGFSGADGTDGVNGADGAPGDQISFNTTDAARVTMIDPAVQHLRTAGYSSVGDGGGALFRRVTSLPGGKLGFQSADGAWWQYAEIILNVIAFGADPTGATSSTDAINTAIRQAGGTSTVYGTGGIVWIPKGDYDVSGGLDLTNIQNSITVRGDGITSTILRAVTSTNAILDMTGTASVTITNLNVNGQSGNATYGALLAHSSINANDVNFFENVSFIGAFYIPISIYGGSDGQFNKMSIQSYNPSSPAMIYISNTNDFGATSVYAAIGTGSTQAGDWIFIGSDLHDLSTFSPATTSTVAPIYLNGDFSPVKFIGGVVGAPTAASSAGVFTVNSPTGSSGGLSIIGMQFYGDNGISPGCIIKLINNYNGLIMQGNKGIAGSAYVVINAGLTLSGANITGNAFSGTTTLATMFSGSCNITGCIIDADSHTFNVGPSGTFSHNVVTRPGSITAGTQTSNGLF